jgi:hypothetical protein
VLQQASSMRFVAWWLAGQANDWTQRLLLTF